MSPHGTRERPSSVEVPHAPKRLNVFERYLSVWVALCMVAGGVLVGVPLALGATRLLRSQLFGVGTVDPPSIGAALGVLALSAAIAGYLPAARAARVGPTEALRAE